MSVAHVKILNVNVLKNVNVILKSSCKGIQKAGNDISYKKFHDVLFNKHEAKVLNRGFRYIDGFMKSYEQNKKGLSYAYHKRIICDDGINTKPLNI